MKSPQVTVDREQGEVLVVCDDCKMVSIGSWSLPNFPDATVDTEIERCIQVAKQGRCKCEPVAINRFEILTDHCGRHAMVLRSEQLPGNQYNIRVQLLGPGLELLETFNG